MTPRQCSRSEDWPALLKLIRAAFATMEGRIDPPSSLHRLTPEGIAQQSRIGEVWAIGTPPVACIFLTPKPHALYLGKLAVAADHRGKGHAWGLIALADTRARALNLPALELETRVELTENHATFRALGFAETGRSAHPGFDHPTSITFRRSVWPPHPGALGSDERPANALALPKSFEGFCKSFRKLLAFPFLLAQPPFAPRPISSKKSDRSFRKLRPRS